MSDQRRFPAQRAGGGTGQPGAAPKRAGQPGAAPKRAGQPGAAPKRTGQPGAAPKRTGQPGAAPKRTGQPGAARREAGARSRVGGTLGARAATTGGGAVRAPGRNAPGRNAPGRNAPGSARSASARATAVKAPGRGAPTRDLPTRGGPTRGATGRGAGDRGVTGGGIAGRAVRVRGIGDRSGRPGRPGRPTTASQRRRPAPGSRRGVLWNGPRLRIGRRGPRAANPDRRLRLALVLTLFLLSLLGGRLVQLQGLDASALAAQALSKRTSTTTLLAHRGDITDASGAVLATTVERRNVVVDQTLVSLYKRRGAAQARVGIRGAAEDLSPLLHLPVDVLVKKLTGTRRFAYVARDVTPEAARTVARLVVPGLNFEQASRRTYPNGQVAANLIGFVGADGKAWGGIEGQFNSVLSGKPGSLTYERGRDGAEIPTGVASEIEPQSGSSVRLTIDRDLQWQFQQVLAAQVADTKAEAGFGVVLDPRTGQVLALVSVPTFDPNHPGKAAPGTTGNRALLDVFEPGSTAKVMTVAAAMEEGRVTPATRFIVPPTLDRGGTTIHDAEVHGVEKLTTAGVLAQSSNIGTIEIGEQVSPKRLGDYVARFGLGRLTGVGLPESRGIVAPASQWSDSQRYTVMYGQGLSVNALQAASVFATIANDGVRVAPRLVAGTTDRLGRLPRRGRTAGHPGGQPAGGPADAADAGERGRRERDGGQGEDPGLPGRGQDRDGELSRTPPAAATAATPPASSGWRRPTARGS